MKITNGIHDRKTETIKFIQSNNKKIVVEVVVKEKLEDKSREIHIEEHL